MYDGENNGIIEDSPEQKSIENELSHTQRSRLGMHKHSNTNSGLMQMGKEFYFASVNIPNRVDYERDQYYT